MISEINRCYGCGACEYICPQKAIAMKPNFEGFLYPAVDYKKCVACGKCKEICPIDYCLLRTEYCDSYAMCSLNDAILSKSASGGMSAEMARCFVEKGGIVCGCTFDYEKKVAKHTIIDNVSDLDRIQGSKYSQSDLREAFISLDKNFSIGKAVLFFGTPCQVTAVNNLYGEKYGDLLYTVDLLCHGVQSPKLFMSYLFFLESKLKGHVYLYISRNKEKGNGYCQLVGIEKDNGKRVEIRIPTYRHSLWFNYQNSYVNRTSCYNCGFASELRVGDITIGDFWGIEKEYPKMCEAKRGGFDITRGISSVLVNSEKGRKLIKLVESDVKIEIVERESIIKHQYSIQNAGKINGVVIDKRNEIYDKLNNDGYTGIEEDYQYTRHMVDKLKDIYDGLPIKTKKTIKKILKG